MPTPLHGEAGLRIWGSVDGGQTRLLATTSSQTALHRKALQNTHPTALFPEFGLLHGKDAPLLPSPGCPWAELAAGVSPATCRGAVQSAPALHNVGFLLRPTCPVQPSSSLDKLRTFCKQSVNEESFLPLLSKGSPSLPPQHSMTGHVLGHRLQHACIRLAVSRKRGAGWGPHCPSPSAAQPSKTHPLLPVPLVPVLSQLPKAASVALQGTEGPIVTAVPAPAPAPAAAGTGWWQRAVVAPWWPRWWWPCCSSAWLQAQRPARSSAKLLAECQDQQWCQFSVHSQVFGPDPCPGTHKYLIASYKCRPDNHRVKTVCENNELRLHCRPKSVLAIYSAHYGRFLRGKPECDAPNAGGPHIECLAPDALRRVSKKCHRKGNCTVTADQATFGDPCLPGTRKQLRVSYTCGGWYKGPRFSRLREDRMIFTSSLAAFAQLWGTWPQSAGLAGDLQAQAPCVLQRGVHPDASLCSSPPPDVPEKVALYFLCGVSAGLALLLCIVSPKAGFLREAREALLGPGGRSEASRTKLRDEQDEDLPDDSSSDSSFRRLTRAYRATDSIFGPELTAAMEGAAEQQGRGGEEIWMPKEASPYTIQKIKSATK
ncbi:protein eva-1 homolog C isoform X2 [Gallus gallus]|uniref:protein eva-1 homolog C isoform X2 n=1 Tax=Gallus gallus TaxID=9031 RepID=UPI001F0049AD|nr:protein eva-1 homolog C isoform X2 [Gallus gallus]